MSALSTVLPLPTKPAVKPDSHEQPTEFPYGWRTIQEIGPDGQPTYRDIALTLDDFLDPQLGDQMPQGPKHYEITNELYNQFKTFFRKQSEVLVLADVKMLWHIPGLQEPFPDVAVIHGVRDTLDLVGSFDCVEHGVRPSLIIEVTSPSYEKGDRQKVDIYRQAGVAEYIIINPRANQPNKPYELTGYRLRGRRYTAIIPDAQGQLLSQTTGIRIGLGADKRTVELYDNATGQRLLRPSEEVAARLAELEARQQAEAQAQQETQRANQAEAQAQQETQRANQAEAQLRQTVLNMQAKGLPLDLISEMTGLSVDEIARM